MRHALGVFGVIAASVLLFVSAAMNWRFGYSLGSSELDSTLLGFASAAADGLKALIPFFLFAALRNKQWSQALAAAVLWTVCLTYSFTSAIGFSAINRADSAGTKTVQAVAFADLRTELEKTRERLDWVPRHRPAETVKSEMDGQRQAKRWRTTNGCAEATASASIAFCQQYHQLGAELAAAVEGAKLQTRVDEIRSQLATATTAAAVVSADPQAKALSTLSGQTMELVSTALTLMVAILVELGSSLGFYVVFSMWRLHEAAPRRRQDEPAVEVTAVVHAAAEVPRIANTPRMEDADSNAATANDNGRQTPKLVAPETDVERFATHRIAHAEGATLKFEEIYRQYTDWCRVNRKEPLGVSSFGRQFSELGIHKVKIAGKMRFNGIKLRALHDEEVMTLPEPLSAPALRKVA